jgi:hypothetical protein
VGVVLNSALLPDAMSALGWAVPLFLGCFILRFLFTLQNVNINGCQALCAQNILDTADTV